MSPDEVILVAARRGCLHRTRVVKALLHWRAQVQTQYIGRGRADIADGKLQWLVGYHRRLAVLVKSVTNR
jgi:hypothetical protein